jgi:hypothetical protein
VTDLLLGEPDADDPFQPDRFADADEPRISGRMLAFAAGAVAVAALCAYLAATIATAPVDRVLDELQVVILSDLPAQPAQTAGG